jgi:SAM-dependent methyltransferase
MGGNEMTLWPDLSVRYDGPELMDDPTCNAAMLFRTLAQFRWVNMAVSRYRFFLKRWIVADMMRDTKRVYHLVDVGAGGCDIVVWLLRHCAGKGLKLKVTALDGDIRIVNWARERYVDVPNLEIVHGQAFDVAQCDDVDYVFSNHVFHHLSDDVIVHLLNVIGTVARRRFLVCDLRRSRFSYVSFTLLAWLLLHNSFSFIDGQISIRKGFAPSELEVLLAQSEMSEHCQILRTFPGRLAIVGERV